MRFDKIEVGEHYRINHETYCWLKITEKLPKFKTRNGIHNCVKGIWSQDKNSSFGMVKVFKASEVTK